MSNYLVGIDEVGRGCVAGPLVACALIIDARIKGVKDSKLLSRSVRESLFDIILNNSIDVGISVISPEYIDEFGLTQANSTAFEIALNKIKSSFNKVIIDGKINYLNQYDNVEAIVKADQKIYCVSAASIIAKVTRDRLMFEYGKIYPEYDFKNNVGYLTKNHLQAIKEYGLTPIHRKSIKYRLT